jgi:HK97 family phage portal protein
MAQMFGGVDQIPMPSAEGGGFGSWTTSGRRVSMDDAMGLPAILSGIRFLAETVATFPLIVYSDQGDQRTREPDSDQWYLLHTKPNDVQTPFNFKAFMVASMIGYGGFCAQYAVSRGKVQGLIPFDPRVVEVRRDKGEVVFKVRRQGQAPLTLTREQVFYIPGVLADDPEIGVSPIRIAANAMGTALSTQEYASRFFANDATPAGVIEFPGNADTGQAKDAKKAWNESGQGVSKAHNTRVLFSGATYRQIGVNANDAQIIEAQRWTVEQAARVLRLPPWALGITESSGSGRQTPEQKNMELLQFCIAPWLVRIEEALHADDKVFPDKDLFPEFLAEGVLRADTAARYAAYLQARQAGWLSVNDIRGKENEPPIEGGDDYQVTPVGGAPNLQPAPAQEGDNVEQPAIPQTTYTPSSARAPDVHLHLPQELKIPAPRVRVEVPAPVVNVEAPVVVVEPPVVNVEPPVVNVAAPTVNVEAPLIRNVVQTPEPKKRKVQFTKDRNGQIDGLEG